MPAQPEEHAIKMETYKRVVPPLACIPSQTRNALARMGRPCYLNQKSSISRAVMSSQTRISLKLIACRRTHQLARAKQKLGNFVSRERLHGCTCFYCCWIHTYLMWISICVRASPNLQRSAENVGIKQQSKLERHLLVIFQNYISFVFSLSQHTNTSFLIFSTPVELWDKENKNWK